MSDDAILHRKTRLWLYVIALLHLVCLGLIHRQQPQAAHASSHYAWSAPADGAPLVRL